MSGPRYVAIAMFIGIALLAVEWRGATGEEQTGRQANVASAKARRDAAKKVYEGSWDRVRSGGDQVEYHTDYYYGWSVRWLQAERDLADDKAGHVAALEGHLERMQYWKAL